MNIGFIGAGNMGGALIGGLKNTHTIFAYDKNPEQVKQLGVKACDSVQHLAESVDVIFLAVKPNVLECVLGELAPYVKNKLIVSVVAGKEIFFIKRFLGEDTRVIRVMPNTPALVGEGMAAVASEVPATEEDTELVVQMLSCVGKAAILPEGLFDAVTGLSGSGPAYVFMMIEALADGGVRAGLPRQVAIELAAQTVLGSAKMVLETKKHPGELKDMVCSPGGTTIEAVAALENGGMRAAFIEAVMASYEKSKQL